MTEKKKTPLGYILVGQAIGVENLDSKKVCLFGHSICLARNGARDVRAMAIAICVYSVTGKVLQPLCSAFKLGMLDVDSSVHDKHAGALSSTRVVIVRGAARLCVGDARQTPIGVLLNDGFSDSDARVLFNVFDLDNHN